jgi:hypothetical protein
MRAFFRAKTQRRKERINLTKKSAIDRMKNKLLLYRFVKVFASIPIRFSKDSAGVVLCVLGGFARDRSS